MCRKAQRHGRKGRGGGKSSSNKRDVGAKGCSYTKLPLTHRGKAPTLLGTGRSLLREARPGMLTELPRQLAGHHGMWKRRRGEQKRVDAATGHPFEQKKKKVPSRCAVPAARLRARPENQAQHRGRPEGERGGRGLSRPSGRKVSEKKLVGIPRRVAESDLSRQRGHTQTFISI